MEALPICALIVGPAIIALGALVMAVRVAAPTKTTGRAGRMVGSFVLLLLAYGIGCCYAGIFSVSAARRGDRTPVWLFTAVAVGGLAVLAIAWMHRTWRLPRPDQRVQEAFDIAAGPDKRWHALLAIGVLALLAAAALIAAAAS
ncbi:MAG: hypothetical protein IPK26_21155 [Planctomycetes bacterium]|nr:hypothetical protein [Planctomycetota bacterium]